MDPQSKKLRTGENVAPPLFNSIEELSQGSQTNKQRYERLVTTFESKYTCKPQFFARAPGRVNIIGEHVDYSGYAVLPMALEQDLTIACKVNDRNEIRLVNVDSSKYEDYTCSVSDFTIDGHKWYNYFLCGFKGMVESVCIQNPVGMDMIIDGNIPPSSGLSSSSAFVCCAALATAFANKIELPMKRDLAELCAKCERYIGTEGGGMDQAISFLGEQGKALMIEFDPIHPTEVQLPDGMVFIISNSLVEAEKAAADSCFNVRVAECRLAAQVIAKKKGKEWKTTRKLLALQESLGLQLSEMSAVVSECLHTEQYSRDELCKILEVSPDELQTESLNEKTTNVNQFNLHDRAKHVYEESNRVYLFAETANSASDRATAEKLGKLMDESHASCKDLYECSCQELDELVSLLKSSGAIGARLTGAGWGGCAVSLVPEKDLQQFLDKVHTGYYDNKPAASASLGYNLFATKPGPGAAICTGFMGD